ncbi:MAG: histidine--tRNA ligase [Planctomycetota bacterium]|nr:histidine--tRNA ligase [Planctomycetota bacterium]
MPPTFQPPKGTRDFYPEDLLRRRWLEHAWRSVSLAHGFEEIDGPAFETIDLYTAKSGEGIVSEIFGVYSGKDEAELARIREGNPAPFALRPEFTPTLARMYAAKAGALPRPCKWFWQQNCFRAERPQRGRLREFSQWNVDFIGGDNPLEADVEVIQTCVGLLRRVGLTPKDCKVRLNDRRLVVDVLKDIGLSEEQMAAGMTLLDKRGKLDERELIAEAERLGLGKHFVVRFTEVAESLLSLDYRRGTITDMLTRYNALRGLIKLFETLVDRGLGDWCEFDFTIVRGLAYYTGTVFEVIADGERAIAGGGRYDGLIETFGGPATPVVGFGMGDVVLSLVLSDKGLMPAAEPMLDQLSQGPRYRPDVYVLPGGKDGADPATIDGSVRRMVAELRARGLHARQTYKSTRNLGKLLKDASDARARFALIVEGEAALTLKDLKTGEQRPISPEEAKNLS